jgi:hypothetical protein
MERVCCKRNFRYCKYRAGAMVPQWLMSTWILTENFRKITAQARKSKSGNSKRNK